MDNFISKTSELVDLAHNLRQDGQDNSDLAAILAQLQAAVAKRAASDVPATTAPPTLTSASSAAVSDPVADAVTAAGLPLVEAKSEPVEPTINYGS